MQTPQATAQCQVSRFRHKSAARMSGFALDPILHPARLRYRSRVLIRQSVSAAVAEVCGRAGPSACAVVGSTPDGVVGADLMIVQIALLTSAGRHPAGELQASAVTALQ